MLKNKQNPQPQPHPPSTPPSPPQPAPSPSPHHPTSVRVQAMPPKGKNWAANQRKKAAHQEAKRRELAEAIVAKDTRGVRTPNTPGSFSFRAVSPGVLGDPTTICIFCMAGACGGRAHWQPAAEPPARKGGCGEAVAPAGLQRPSSGSGHAHRRPSCRCRGAQCSDNRACSSCRGPGRRRARLGHRGGGGGVRLRGGCTGQQLRRSASAATSGAGGRAAVTRAAGARSCIE